MRLKLTLALIALFALAGTVYAQGGGFSSDWWTVDGGGGVSTGGSYRLTDSIGQPDAGYMAGGDYSLSGGFLVQNENAPGPIYLPLVASRLCVAAAAENEPNNNTAQANPLCLGRQIAGSHDGAAGTGDLYRLVLSAGAVQLSLDTANGDGVQLLLYYDNGGSLELVGQDTILPFELGYTAAAGTYYVYVYSDDSTGNTAIYSLVANTARADILLPAFDGEAASPPAPEQ